MILKPCKVSFHFMKVPNMLNMHWSNYSNWGMTNATCCMRWCDVTLVHPQQARFVFVSCDEITTIDNQN